MYQQGLSAGGLCLRMSFFRVDLFSVSCRRIDSEKYGEFLVFGISPPALITLRQARHWSPFPSLRRCPADKPEFGKEGKKRFPPFGF